MKGFFKRYGRWISPSAFGIVIICFAMPFMGIKCGDESLVTVSAFDVAFGGVYPKHLEGKTKDVEKKEKDDVKFRPPNFLMSIGLLIFIVAGLCAFGRNMPAFAFTLFCGGLAGFITIVYRILASISFASSMKPSAGEMDFSGLVRLDWRYGFWCILLFCAAALITRIYYERVRE